ncbi:formimidoylglutamase [bacterium]|nr:formimidoylglutamase [bacterium]
MNQDQLFSLTTRPNPDLFFRSKDPNDYRLGAVAEHKIESYQKSRFVIVSCSQDEGINRNSGRIGAAKGPAAIRQAFYKLAAPEKMETGDLFDLGDTAFDDSLEKIHQRHYQIVESLLRDGKKIIVLGGGNDLSYPDCKAHQQVFPKTAAVNIDAHLDIRKNLLANSGTPYRQLIDENIIEPHRFYEIGIQKHANSKVYLNHAHRIGINIITLDDIQQAFINNDIDTRLNQLRSESLFIGLDMDSIRASDAPGVSAPSPIGLSGEQAVFLLRYLIGKNRVNLLEITEMNPIYDLDSRTAKLAAILALTYLDNSVSEIICP